MTDKAVILARGLGTRMRKQDAGVALDENQAKVAEKGIKALIKIDRPFLDYVLSALADAGYKKVCLVIGPEHTELREYYGALKSSRVEISFGVQEKPLGTADAVRACEQFAGGDDFIVINSDNYYPAEAMKQLREISGAGLAAFEKQAMLDGSNIPADRIAAFAVASIDDAGNMKKIIEKPDPQTLASLGDDIYVSMNCWRFTSKIFQACASIEKSKRGEYELPDAVQYSIEKLGETYKALRVKAPVLDLSCRGDIEPVAARLRGMEVKL